MGTLQLGEALEVAMGLATVRAMASQEQASKCSFGAITNTASGKILGHILIFKALRVEEGIFILTVRTAMSSGREFSGGHLFCL